MEDKKLEGVIRKIEALLNTNGCTEAEAQARTEKAQELLEAYNLDMAILGQSGKGAQRKDTKRQGGLYSWQRKLWQAVAELNFCYYMSIRGLARGSVYEHRLIGSHGNVIATEKMAGYLQDTVERLAQQWAKENYYKSVFVREAIAYREGMAQRLSERLKARRDEIVAEERRKEEERKREQQRTNADTGGTALTILDVISTEADFNNDYLNHWELGTTARNRVEAEARRAAAMREWEEARRKQAEWDALHPEEAAARKAKEAALVEAWLKEQSKKEAARQRRVNKTPPKPRYRRETAEEQRAGMSSYREGRAKGDTVGIDTQAEDKRTKGRLA